MDERDEDPADRAEDGAPERQRTKAKPGARDPGGHAPFERSGIDRPQADQPACLYDERDDEPFAKAEERAGSDRGDDREVDHVASIGGSMLANGFA